MRFIFYHTFYWTFNEFVHGSTDVLPSVPFDNSLGPRMGGESEGLYPDLSPSHSLRPPQPPRSSQNRNLSRIKARLAPIIEGWRSGSVPIPRFNHRTREEVVKFLEYYGKSIYGYFGLDKTHRPTLTDAKTETIPGWFFNKAFDVTATLGRTIYKHGQTGVYELRELPNKIIKYHAYCYDRKYDPIDAVVVETYFANRVALADSRLTVRVDFYSAFTRITTVSPKIEDPNCPDLVDDNGNFISTIRPQIRYLIMEKVGLSLDEYMRAQKYGTIPFIIAMKLGGQMIDLLRRLHAQNIVHGDAHAGNFAFSDSSNKKLILIDFGRAELLDAEFQAAADPATFCPDEFYSMHVLQGWWEMRLCKRSFRDDVYRAIQNVATSIHGTDHIMFLKSLMTRKGFPKYIEIKSEAKFWEFDDMPLVVVDPEHSDTVRGHLMKISALTVEDHPEAPYTKPKYMEIMDQFKEIISVITGQSKDDPRIFDL